MSIQSSFFPADHDDGPYASSHAGERALNRAIVTAEISRSFEEYLEIFDRFYAEDIEVSSATSTGQIRGKARVSSVLYDFLVDCRGVTITRLPASNLAWPPVAQS